MSAVALELELPESAVGVVLISHADDGGLLARYAEGRGHVPAPRREIAEVLVQLAMNLLADADRLEDKENSRG